jgi:hypothetical protein
MQNLDTNVDIFLLYEELDTMEGKSPPMAKKDLSEFLNVKRRMFVKCFCDSGPPNCSAIPGT